MNRSTLESAIELGLRQSQSRNIPAKTSVADAIEMALELEKSMSAPDKPRLAAIQSQEEPLPPKLGSVSNLIPSADPTLAPPADDPDLSPTPTPSSVFIAGAADMDREIEARRPTGSSANKPAGPLRVKRLFIGNKLRIGMEGLAKWANQEFPRTIRVVPRGVDHEIELELAVKIFPMVGDGRDYEKESSIKITYRHPSLGPDMEVGISIRVADAQDSFPDVAECLERIKIQAVELYRQRPRYIESLAPTGPGLDGQYRSIPHPSSAKSKTEIHKQRANPAITFIDSEDTSLARS